MSVLALKAIDYGAEQIPDKFFEKIPGGFFTPAEKKKIKKDRDAKKDKKRHSSEQRSSKRSSRRDRSAHSDYSDSASDDSDYEHDRDRRRSDRSRRAKSAGRPSSRSLSRGRDDRRSEHFDGESSDNRDMAQAEQGGPYFPPPPSSEYRPYNPQDYASGQPQGDYRPSSAGQPYGYPPQVNNDFFLSRSATVPTMAAFSSPVNVSPMSRPPMMMSRPPSNLPTPLSPQPPFYSFLRQGTPLSAAFSPSTEPPLAALFSRPLTNTPKPATAPPHSSAAAARYAPGPGYAPSPPVNSHIPAPPVGTNAPYSPYNPSDYTSNAGGYQPSPPPFNRQRSNSQPANPPYPTYIPPGADQRMTAYDEHNQPPSRRGSTKPRREHRHRARSADTQSSSRKENDRNPRRDSSRMTKMRERFDDGFLREGGLAASLGGALVGGFAGNKVGRSKLTTRSRDRSPPRGLRARSRSVIDRFRSKSRGPEDRRGEDRRVDDRRVEDRRTDDRRDRHDRSDRHDRPDRGYERGRDDEYDYFSSESEGDGSPVASRRHRKRRDY
ncbi:hypothetical protein CC86DRAFT_182450 [Ophiobolus disseminans]|uniref:PRP38-assoc multi-domain protein n=1 Tax=Ophiobolus disseminans TaxID=1469910 RepID=A0A6A7AAB0_9PLEO|nr:hypothetical protein CC86DRAFT_182450 [Ophiobolus disseminans]